MIYIEYDITIALRDWALKAFLARKTLLGIGMPTLCYNMQKTIQANRHRVCMIDRTPINTDAINPRSLQNFASGMKSTPQTMYPILAYLVLIEDDQRNAANNPLLAPSILAGFSFVHR